MAVAGKSAEQATQGPGMSLDKGWFLLVLTARRNSHAKPQVWKHFPLKNGTKQGLSVIAKIWNSYFMHEILPSQKIRTPVFHDPGFMPSDFTNFSSALYFKKQNKAKAAPSHDSWFPPLPPLGLATVLKLACSLFMYVFITVILPCVIMTIHNSVCFYSNKKYHNLLRLAFFHSKLCLRFTHNGTCRWGLFTLSPNSCIEYLN